jgi:hypothetical protein
MVVDYAMMEKYMLIKRSMTGQIRGRDLMKLFRGAK